MVTTVDCRVFIVVMTGDCRVFIVVMTGVAVAWVPVVKEIQGGQVFIYIQEITNYLAPPVATVFLMAIFFHFVNEQVRALLPLCMYLVASTT